jgi:hypothetical protein
MNYRRVANSRPAVVKKKTIEYESALQAEGIGAEFFARKLRDLLGAKVQRWNPKKESWEEFEDSRTQLAALSETAKILDIYPAEEGAGDYIGVKVIIPPDCPRPGRQMGSGEESVGTAARDGSERCER